MKFNLADENRNLRLRLTEEQEKFSLQKKCFTDKIIDLENKVSDLEFLNAEQSINLKALEEELINKSSRRPDSTSTKASTDNCKSNSPSCFTLHTSSISGINDYISLLAKAKDDVINYKKESVQLHTELEQYKQKLLAKKCEIEKLKSDLEYAKTCKEKKVCSCHEVDSSYESLEDTRSENHFRPSKSCKSRSSCQDCNPRSSQKSERGNCGQGNVSDASVQVNELESILKNRLDEYIRKAKDIIPGGGTSGTQIVSALEEERDYYCREYHRLKDKVLHAFRTPDRHPASECPFSVLDQIKTDLRWQRDEIEELKKAFSSRKESRNQYNCSNPNLEDRIKRLENRELELSSINEKLASKVRKLEDHCSEYRERIRVLTKENNQQKSVYNQVRMMQDDSERSLFNAQEALRKCDSELNCALGKITQLEEENKRIKRDLNIVENEKKCLKKNLVQLDHEKDNIGMKLDEKTELVVRFEKELMAKKKRVSDLELKVSKLEDSLKMLQNINIRTEEGARHAKKSYSTMQQELHDLQNSKEALVKENRRLQDNLSSAVRDCFQSNNELQAAKSEVEELKIRLQSYVSEVRRIEDILQIKEDERRCMLEQLKGLNMEYSSNNSKNRTLDNSDNVPFDNLSDFRERYRDYGNDILEDR